MEFRVLGSIEACDGGRAIALGGPQQRRLLAVLLADAGKVVSVDRLVEAVWSGDAAPEGAARTTRTYVSRLRTALGDGFVVTREPGYLIDVTGAEFDRDSFDELVVEARRLEPGASVERYDDALGRWRGQAFAEFAEEWWARPEATRLEELRLVAAEERIEALLALDRHAEAVPDLDRLAVAHPYRERFTAQLMVALQRSGREAEAHRAYEQLRTRLAEDTGLEPSSELTRLDRAIATAGAVSGPADEPRRRGYAIGELLGQGAFGAVYRAIQPGLGREVALKVINAELADDASFVRHFEAEAQLVSRLEHPHIVPLYDFWREPGGAYLVFRLLRGGTAAEALVRDGPWLLDRADRLVNEVGSALVAAHAAGVVHRDVKPGNILFDEAGNAYLADFGIAQVDGVGDETDALASAGSPLYVSPEQIRDRQASARSDQYSLAATVWELLTGEAPFTGDDVTAVLVAKLQHGLPSLRTRRPDVGEAIDFVIATAGSANPADRFPSVADMLLAWRQALGAPAGGRSTGDLDVATAPRSLAARTMVRVELAAANPYKGLRAFREADAVDFFGRSAVVGHLASLVAGNRIVVVVGPSGSGKSSLVHAGLVPLLRADDRVLVASMVPGSHPLDELSVALSRVATRALPLEPARLASDRGIDRAVRSIAPDDGDLVLVVDQLEELWTVSDRDERDQFLAGLAQAVDDPHSALRVVMTVRADFFDRPLQDPSIGPRVAAGTFGVTPLSATDLLDAIVEPAARVGVGLEPGLAAELAAEVVGQPASLPLLQFALTELYDARTGATLTTAAYRALGGVAGAVARRADEVYDSLDADDQQATHELFTRLVAIGEGRTDTRRRVRLSELAHLPSSIIELFGSHRLLAFDTDPATREPTVEVAHEALLVRWPRLRAWIDDDRQWLGLRRHLSIAAGEWETGGREPSELYRGARLATALEALDAHPGALTENELALLEASRSARDADTDRQRRAARRLRGLLIGALGALVLALVAGAVAVLQQRSARDSADRATSTAYRAETGRLLAAARSLDTGDTPVAALLALEASRRQGVDGADAEATLQQVLSAKPSFLGAFPTVGEYAFGLDGGTFVSRTAKGIEVYDLATRARRAQVEHPAVRGIPGRRLATGDDGLLVETAGDGEVRRYRLPALEPAGDPIVTAGSIEALAMSANAVLATANPGGLVEIWDAAGGRQLGRFRTDGDVQRLDLSADGSRVAVLTAGSAQVWNTNAGVPVGPAISQTSSDIALSPDRQRVALSVFGMGAVFDPADGAEIAPLQAQGQYLRFIDDNRIAVSGASITVVDTATGTSLTSNATTCGCDLAISPDGRTVATGLDGPGLYALDGRELLADALDAPGLANAAGFSVVATTADGRRLSASAYGAGTTTFERTGDDWRVMDTTLGMLGTVQPDGRVLRVDPGTRTATLFDPASGATSAAFPGPGDDDFPVVVGLSADSRFEAFGGLDGSVTVVDTQAATTVATLTDLQELNAGNEFPATSFVAGAAFSQDGRWLAAAAWSGAAIVWDTTTWRRATVLEPAIADVDGAVTPAFDPTGRYLAVSRGRTSIDMFDANTLRLVKSIPLGVQGLPYRALFDQRGERLAVVLDAAGVLVYDVASGRRVLAPLPADLATGATFLDATTMAVAAPAKQRVMIWHLDAARLEAEACRAAGRNLTRDEWARLGPAGESYRLTCPQFDEPPADPTLSVEQPPVSVQTPPS